MKNNLEKTMAFNSEDFKEKNISNVLNEVSTALEEKGYNSVNQLAGYLVSNDPAYISSHKNARTLIQSVDRYEIVEELVKFYLTSKK